jgi:hypothetical protein
LAGQGCLQRTVVHRDDPDVPAPSVITLNASTAAQAANDFLFYMTGLASPTAFDDYVRSQRDEAGTFREPQLPA